MTKTLAFGPEQKEQIEKIIKMAKKVNATNFIIYFEPHLEDELPYKVKGILETTADTSDEVSDMISNIEDNWNGIL